MSFNELKGMSVFEFFLLVVNYENQTEDRIKKMRDGSNRPVSERKGGRPK